MPKAHLPKGEPILNIDELERRIDPASSREYQERLAGLMDEIVPMASLLQPTREELPALAPPARSGNDEPLLRLLSVYSNRVSDERMKQAAHVLADESLTANDKLTRIDGLLPFPPTASAEQLGEMLGVSKQAVMKTVWWRKNRRGESDEEIERRHAQHKERGKKYEPPRSDDDDEER